MWSIVGRQAYHGSYIVQMCHIKHHMQFMSCGTQRTDVLSMHVHRYTHQQPCRYSEQQHCIPEELRSHNGMSTIATKQGSKSRKGKLVVKQVMQ